MGSKIHPYIRRWSQPRHYQWRECWRLFSSIASSGSSGRNAIFRCYCSKYLQNTRTNSRATTGDLTIRVYTRWLIFPSPLASFSVLRRACRVRQWFCPDPDIVSSKRQYQLLGACSRCCAICFHVGVTTHYSSLPLKIRGQKWRLQSFSSSCWRKSHRWSPDEISLRGEICSSTSHSRVIHFFYVPWSGRFWLDLLRQLHFKRDARRRIQFDLCSVGVLPITEQHRLARICRGVPRKWFFLWRTMDSGLNWRANRRLRAEWSGSSLFKSGAYVDL